MALRNILKKRASGELSPQDSYVLADYVGRLESILKKRTLSDAKLDEFKIKWNIIRAFTQQQKEEKIRRAESEL